MEQLLYWRQMELWDACQETSELLVFPYEQQVMGYASAH